MSGPYDALEEWDDESADAPMVEDTPMPETPPAPAAPVRMRAPSVEAPEQEKPDVDWADLGRRLQAITRGSQGTRDSENYFANVAPGYKPDMQAGEQLIKAEKAPLEMQQAAQARESNQLGIETKRAGLGAMKAKGASDAADRDPNSMQSQKARNAIKAAFPGLKTPDGFDDWSASDVKRFFDPGTMGRLEASRATAANAAADDQRKIAAANDKAEAEKAVLENSRKNYSETLKKMGVNPATASEKDIDRAISMYNADASRGIAERNADRADQPKLTTSALNDLADFDVADGQLAQLEQDFNQLGMSGGLAKASGKASEALGLTGTDAAIYLNKAKQAQQVVGKILEGGKLAAGDEAKYKSLVPQPGDSPSLLTSKISGLRKFLGDMKAGRVKLYKSAGYKTPEAPKETRVIDGVEYRKRSDGKWVTDG